MKQLAKIDEEKKANAIFGAEKSKLIKDKLMNNPKLNLEELDQEVKNNGFFGILIIDMNDH